MHASPLLLQIFDPKVLCLLSAFIGMALLPAVTLPKAVRTKPLALSLSPEGMTSDAVNSQYPALHFLNSNRPSSRRVTSGDRRSHYRMQSETVHGVGMKILGSRPQRPVPMIFASRIYSPLWSGGRYSEPSPARSTCQMHTCTLPILKVETT